MMTPEEYARQAHALWRELLQCEPFDAYDDSVITGALEWAKAASVEHSELSERRLDQAVRYLEHRAALMRGRTEAQHVAAEDYRRRQRERRQLEGWRKADVVFVDKNAHDGLFPQSQAEEVPLGIGRSATFTECVPQSDALTEEEWRRNAFEAHR